MDEAPQHGVTGFWRSYGDVSKACDSATSRKGRFDWLTLGSALVTLVLTVYLVFQFGVASVDSQELPPSTEEITGYWMTAAIVIAIQVALLVRAIRLRRIGLQVISTVALIMAIGVSLLLSVPPIDWRPDVPSHTTNPNYVPCYSGSGDCVGG